MPSRLSAAALIAVVLLAGCSALVGGGDDATPTATTRSHELVFASFTDGEPFEANVTVTKDGEGVYQRTVTSDGKGTYAVLTSFDEQGPYTVHVNTTIPQLGGGTEKTRFEVVGEPRNATVVHAEATGVRHDTLALPRNRAGTGIQILGDVVDENAPVELDVQVWYRGERVVSTTERHDEITQVELNGTGAYRVAVESSDGSRRERLVVVATDDQSISVSISRDGSVDGIRVTS